MNSKGFESLLTVGSKEIKGECEITAHTATSIAGSDDRSATIELK